MVNMTDCPVKYALDLLNGKWKLRIIWELNQQEIIRFNELQRRLTGISSVMLSKTLEELERNKIINRRQYNEIPPKVEYSLTDLGKAIEPALQALGNWGSKAYTLNEKS
ncbi:MAG: winged helix-turn-helix transcriptional regulator [Blautia sp.]